MQEEKIPISPKYFGRKKLSIQCELEGMSTICLAHTELGVVPFHAQ